MSKDGTKVPMFLVHKADIKLDGTNPTLLYGYGGESCQSICFESLVVCSFVMTDTMFNQSCKNKMH